MTIYRPKQHPSFYKDFSHTMEDRTPYTYLIGWTEHNIWYYGRRTKYNCHPFEFFNRSLAKRNRYETSSDYVNEFISKNGLPDVVQIRQIFKNLINCINWEIHVLTKIDAKNNLHFLNKDNGDGKFHRSGILHSIETKEKMKIAAAHKTLSADHKSNLKLARNTQKTKEQRAETLRNKDDLICPNCNTKCDAGNAKQHHFDNCSSISDRRKVSCILCHIAMRPCDLVAHQSQCEMIQHIPELWTCPNCNTSGKGIKNAKQHHYDNCSSISDRRKVSCILCHIAMRPCDLVEHQSQCKMVQHIPELWTCPNCNTSGKGRGNAKRWHFDNCKHKQL